MRIICSKCNYLKCTDYPSVEGGVERERAARDGPASGAKYATRARSRSGAACDLGTPDSATLTLGGEGVSAARCGRRIRPGIGPELACVAG